MTGLTDKDRQELSELLPFYLNGTLDGEDQARVEAALADDAALRADLEFLKTVQAETQAREVGSSPGEFGLARLMRDIDAERGQEAAPRGGTLVWKLAAAACFALFLATSALLVTSPDSGLRLAGGGGTEAVHAGPQFTVAFVETAPEAKIRTLLLSLDLEIVSGPSALGLYTLQAPEGADAALIAAKLAAAQGLVESVERED